MKPKPQFKWKKRQGRLTTLGLCLGGSFVAAGAGLFALPATADDAARIEKLEKENQDLLKRLDALEGIAKKEGILPSGDAPPSLPVKALSSMNISGFVTASYFYDTSEPSDGSPNGYLWNRHHNSFTLNKFKLTLASPAAERSGDKWDAGYRVSLIFGEDAPIVNTGGEFQGFEPLREAYVDLNVPLGTGLNVKAGQLISLLNFESGDGSPVNPNFSQGNQWFFTGNGPSAGVQVGYTFTDWLSMNARVQNGLYTGAIDGNGFKTLMGNFAITPDKYTSISLIGFGGREGADSSLWLKGGSLIASRKLMEKYNLNVATELDYFSLETGPSSDSYWWSIGGWVWMDFTPKIGIALRGDYIGDPDGVGTAGLLGFANMPTAPVNPGNNTGQDLTSLTLTLNYRPVPNIVIKPEIRYDHTSLKNGFDGKEERVIFGAGVSYLF